MPEGDTVWRTARRLHQVFAERICISAELRWGEKDAAPLVGLATLEVVPRGKHILHRFEGGVTLHSHLRMDGSWRIAEPRTPTRSRAIRAVLATEQYLALGLDLGMLDLLPTSREHTLVGHLGPDILGPDWDESQAIANLSASPAPIGAALLEQRNLAGIGTLYCSEALFIEKCSPWVATTSMPTEALHRVVRRARRLMRGNLEHAIQSTTGSRRRGEERYVHARSGLPCRRCGVPVRVQQIGVHPYARAMFYCAACQGGLGPGDGGGVQAPLQKKTGKRR